MIYCTHYFSVLLFSLFLTSKRIRVVLEWSKLWSLYFIPVAMCCVLFFLFYCLVTWCLVLFPHFPMRCHVIQLISLFVVRRTWFICINYYYWLPSSIHIVHFNVSKRENRRFFHQRLTRYIIKTACGVCVCVNL